MLCQVICVVTLSVTTPASVLPKGLTFNHIENFSSQVQVQPANIHLTRQEGYIDNLYQAQMISINGKSKRHFMPTPQRTNGKYMLGGEIYSDPLKQFTFHGNTYFMDRVDQ